MSSFFLLITADDLHAKQPGQFVLINSGEFSRIRKEFGDVSNGLRQVGIGAIFSYFQHPPARVEADLRAFLEKSSAFSMPVLIALDGEYWLGARSDLWNWWDPSIPGFDPSNRENVEWHSWSPDDALKIAWLNWGRQIRVRPPMNLMSPRYRAACHVEMRRLVPIIESWWKGLPAEKQHLFVGLKLGWESSIGVNKFYYPNGNALLEQSAEHDPKTGLKTDELPGRGVVTIGYAAAKTAGIRTEGALTEADQAEVARRHLADLCALASRLGLPREKIFTHAAGWKEGELLYEAAVNSHSCPGWSFYRHAGNPLKDTGVQEALRKSDAPCWAAVEWLYQGPAKEESWRAALDNTLSDPRCRFLCIFNWRNIEHNKAALEAVRGWLRSK